MRRRRILILGDSHTHALQLACEVRGSQDADIEIVAYRFSKMKDGKDIGDLSVENALEMIAALSPSDLLVSTIGGNQHSTFGLVQHPQPFTFFEPRDEAATLSEGVACIPYRILWDHFEKGMRGGDGARLQQIRDAANCPVVHVAPPPPKSDEAHIRASHETAFAQAGILDKGVSPSTLRLKLWKLQTEVSRRLFKKFDVRQVPPPGKAVDSEGFLKPKYYAGDATHANRAYGELVLRQLERLVLSETAIAKSA